MKRIRKQWIRVKQFGRFLFPMRAVESSILAIFTLQLIALEFYTKRELFAYNTSSTYVVDDKFLSSFEMKFFVTMNCQHKRDSPSQN